ncbi:MAG: arylformamidase [Betaproteobacteria bacterium]|nr:arylformamidase [Betaproteobacteria bacterium]
MNQHATQGADYYERQYNNRLAIPNAADYNARAKRLSTEARLLLPCTLDVAYGSSPRERLDIFPGRGPGPHPLLIFIHSGYWRSRDKSEFSFIAPPFVAAGVTVALPSYDLAPGVTVEKIVQQMLAAVAWLYRNAGQHEIDRNRIFVAGHSAGGHLAAMMLAAQWREYGSDLPPDLLKGGYAISGVYDLLPLLQFSFNDDIGLDADSARKVSPLTYRPAHPVALYTAVGALESDEFKRQAHELQHAWAHCHTEHMEARSCHHLSILEAIGNKRHPLFHSMLRMMSV